MKKLLSIALLLSSLSLTAMDSKEAEATKTRADDAYEQGELDEAIGLYESLTEEYHSASVEFNLGNAYFRQKRIPNAILHYERAMRVDPSSVDVQHNLTLARNLTVDRVESEADSGITEWWNSKLLSLGETNWALLGILFAFVFAGLIVLFYWRRQSNWRQMYVGLAGLSLILCLLLTYFSFAAHIAMTARDAAVIMNPKVDILSAPNAGSTELFVLHEGTRVRVVQDSGPWLNISLPNGLVGWVKKEDVEVI